MISTFLLYQCFAADLRFFIQQIFISSHLFLLWHQIDSQIFNIFSKFFTAYAPVEHAGATAEAEQLGRIAALGGTVHEGRRVQLFLR